MEEKQILESDQKVVDEQNSEQKSAVGKKNENSIFEIDERNSAINWINLYRIGISIVLTFGACISIFFFLFRFKVIAEAGSEVLKASSAILIGLFLAFIMNPVFSFINDNIYKYLTEKMNRDKMKARKISKVSGIALTTFMLIGFIALLGVAVIPSIIRSCVHLVNALPDYANTIIDFIENGQFGDSIWAKIAQNIINEATDYLENWVQNSLLSQAQTYLTQITNGVISVFKGFLNFIIGIIVMDYVMAIQDSLTGQTKKCLYAVCKGSTANAIINFGRKASDVFGGFITGKVIDSMIIAVICYIGCTILKIPDAVLVSAIIGITNIIPFFGPFVGAVPSLFLVAVQSPLHALYLLVFIIVLQQVDGNIIGPKILGSSTGLSSFWIMVAILIGGGVFGIAGMIFGVPVVALIYYLIHNLVEERLKRKNLPLDTNLYRNASYFDTKTNTLVEKIKDKKEKKKKS